jgi:hypothetical protein
VVNVNHVSGTPQNVVLSVNPSNASNTRKRRTRHLNIANAEREVPISWALIGLVVAFALDSATTYLLANRRRETVFVFSRF